MGTDGKATNDEDEASKKILKDRVEGGEVGK